MTTTPSDEAPAGNLALAYDTRPGVTSVNPASGTDGGGDMVTISGINLTDATSVRFGGQDALVYKVLADNTITAQTPRAIDGQLLVEVTVSTPIGTSQSSTASTFAYIAAAGAWRPIHTLALVAIVVAMVILSVAIPGSSGFTPGVARQWSWIAALVLLALFIMVAGQGITDRWEGLFIDERNKITLSRLQLVLWVVLIVSAFFALALANVVLGADNPLQIAVPIEIWEVLGISTVSLVGSPLILGSKASKTPDSNQAGATMNNVAKLDNAPAAAVTNVGVVVVKTSPQYARWSDLFRGEETGNADYLDMSKIQMFFFTIVLVAAYAAALFGMFASGRGLCTRCRGSTAAWLRYWRSVTEPISPIR